MPKSRRLRVARRKLTQRCATCHASILRGQSFFFKKDDSTAPVHEDCGLAAQQLEALKRSSPIPRTVETLEVLHKSLDHPVPAPAPVLVPASPPLPPDEYEDLIVLEEDTAPLPEPPPLPALPVPSSPSASFSWMPAGAGRVSKTPVQDMVSLSWIRLFQGKTPSTRFSVRFSQETADLFGWKAGSRLLLLVDETHTAILLRSTRGTEKGYTLRGQKGQSLLEVRCTYHRLTAPMAATRYPWQVLSDQGQDCLLIQGGHVPPLHASRCSQEKASSEPPQDQEPCPGWLNLHPCRWRYAAMMDPAKWEELQRRWRECYPVSNGGSQG